MIKRLVLLFFLLMGGVLLHGCAPRNSELAINNAWARPGTTGSNSAVYFTIENPLPNPDTLLKAEGDIAESVELHKSMLDDQGTMMMRPIESIAVDAKTKVEFKPGALHVMLFNLKRDLNTGDLFTLTFHFQSNPDLTVQVLVKDSPE